MTPRILPYFFGGTMQESYYIGEFRSKRRKGHWFIRLFICLLALFISASVWTHFALLSQVRTLCNATLANRLEALGNAEAYRILREEGYTYEDFVRLTYDTNGMVRSASVDTVQLNLLKMRLATEILTALHDENVTVSVPLGNLLGHIYLSGKGKEIAINARVAKRMHARFHTVFLSSGINQTHHKIGFSLHFTASYLLPTGTESVSFVIDIPIGETLIVGEVPDSLTQINRLSDDVTEVEIDDAVDFGNILS